MPSKVGSMWDPGTGDLQCARHTESSASSRTPAHKIRIDIRVPQNGSFQVDIDAAASVQVLKKRIERRRPELVAECLHLVLQGRILRDWMTMKDCDIKHGQYVIAIATRTPLHSAQYSAGGHNQLSGLIAAAQEIMRVQANSRLDGQDLLFTRPRQLEPQLLSPEELSINQHDESGPLGEVVHVTHPQEILDVVDSLPDGTFVGLNLFDPSIRQALGQRSQEGDPVATMLVTGHGLLQRQVQERERRQMDRRALPEDHHSPSADLDHGTHFAAVEAPQRGQLQRGVPSPGQELIDWRKESLPPPAENELEFLIKDYPRCDEQDWFVASPSHTVGNFTFKLIIFPRGDHPPEGGQTQFRSQRESYLGAFFQAVFRDGMEAWEYRDVRFMIVMVNWRDYRRSLIASDTTTFSWSASNRGVPLLIQTSEITESEGWLGPDNSLCFRAACYVKYADTFRINDRYVSRAETDCVGLRIPRAASLTGCMIQSLFQISKLRQILHACVRNKFKHCVATTLDSMFGRLAMSQEVVSFKNELEVIRQNIEGHIEEYSPWALIAAISRDLDMLDLEGVEKDSARQLRCLFEGDMETYVECLDLDYQSVHQERFHGLHLDVRDRHGKDFPTIQDSLEDFLSSTVLEGENGLNIEGYGKQRAKAGVRLKQLPEILPLHLKRLCSDADTGRKWKLTSRLTYPTRLNLSKYSRGAGVYELHAVIVHTGGVEQGHYHVHVRRAQPVAGLCGKWVKLDGETVVPCSEFAAVRANYGGDDLIAWNYFERSPHELRELGPAAASQPRWYSANTLIYVKVVC